MKHELETIRPVGYDEDSRAHLRTELDANQRHCSFLPPCLHKDN